MSFPITEVFPKGQHPCVSPYCPFEVDDQWNACPNCANYQPAWTIRQHFASLEAVVTKLFSLGTATYTQLGFYRSAAHRGLSLLEFLDLVERLKRGNQPVQFQFRTNWTEESVLSALRRIRDELGPVQRTWPHREQDFSQYQINPGTSFRALYERFFPEVLVPVDAYGRFSQAGRGLRDRELAVLILHFGLDGDGTKRSLYAIAKMLGRSSWTISKWAEDASLKLRGYRRRRLLRGEIALSA